MSGAKPSLGYPSRTAAVIALRQQGCTTREIAERVGIEPKTVTALECSAWPRRATTGQSGTVYSHDFGSVPLNIRQMLRPHAAKRGMTTDRLMREIIEAVVIGKLVDAVLDDDPEGDW